MLFRSLHRFVRPALLAAAFLASHDLASAQCATFYCTGKTTSTGCIPFLTTDPGCPSLTATGKWNIYGNDHLATEAGFLLYSNKKSNLNYHGGKLCVKSPITRTPIAKAKSAACINPYGTCGTTACRRLIRDFKQTIQSGSDPTLTPGAVRYAQMRQRDPGDPWGDNLSDGVRFTIAP